VSVDNGFTDESVAMSDLAGMQPIFPPSLAYFANGSGNRTAALYQEMLSDNITAIMVPQTLLFLKLPEKVEQGGEEYETGGSVLEIEAQGGAQNLTSLNVSLDFTATGNSMAGITAVRSALPGTQLVQWISGTAAQAAGSGLNGGTGTAAGTNQNETTGAGNNSS
jgi:hypothetical protein